MPHWMKSADHGVMPVYDLGEVDRHKKLGWVLLNTGEAPDLGAKVEQPKPVPKDLSIPDTSDHDEVRDILDLPVVEILPQFSGMSRQDLEALRAREAQGKARKGLLAAMDNVLKG